MVQQLLLQNVAVSVNNLACKTFS